MGAFFWIIVIGTSVWVYFDAKTLGVKKGLIKGFADMGPAGWGICTLLLWIVAFPAYIAMRPKFKKLLEQ